MAKIFISYGRDESHGQNLATEVQKQLLSAGFEVFRDVISLKGGDYWLRKLEQELRGSQLVILVLSKKVLESKWVPNEINLAEDLEIPVVPVFAEIIELPLWLRHLHVINFSEQENWLELLNAVNVHIGISEVELSDSPSWANQYGEDQYGQYADLQINKVSQRFRLINPGTFWMGSPKSEAGRLDWEAHHHVTLSKSFWLADTTVTQALWLEIFGCNPASFTYKISNPVECVSWYASQKLVTLLNERFTDLGACLPTEAQWEYACRAGTSTPFSFGNQIPPEQVNYTGDFSCSDSKATMPVRSFPANPWGLCGMHGNVWEWCQDAWQEDLGSKAVIDPILKQGESRVIRGGSWDDGEASLRSACRYSLLPDDRNDLIGLRLAIGQLER